MDKNKMSEMNMMGERKDWKKEGEGGDEGGQKRDERLCAVTVKLDFFSFPQTL